MLKNVKAAKAIIIFEDVQHYIESALNSLC